MNQSTPSDGGRIDDSWWAALAARILPSHQVQIIEALRWIERPLSAGDLVRLFDDQPSWAALGHHLRCLAKVRAIELGEAPTPQNVTDIAFRLVVSGEGHARR